MPEPKDIYFADWVGDSILEEVRLTFEHVLLRSIGLNPELVRLEGRTSKRQEAELLELGQKLPWDRTYEPEDFCTCPCHEDWD